MPLWEVYSYTVVYDFENGGKRCEASSGIVEPEAPVQVKPRISGPSTVWWFNGATPTGYATQITLSTSCDATHWQWTVTSGASFVTLGNNGSCGITVQGAAPSGSPNDVSITVTVNGVTSDPFNLTVLAPTRLVPNGVSHGSSPDFGYLTNIIYVIQDQFGAPLPASIEINEQ
jgi:hypothetical protein